MRSVNVTTQSAISSLNLSKQYNFKETHIKTYTIYEQRNGIVKLMATVKKANSREAMDEGRLMGVKWPIIGLPPEELAYVVAKEQALP